VAVAVAYFNILAIAVWTSPYRGNNRYRVEEQLVTASGTATVRWGKRKIMFTAGPVFLLGRISK
jgi:hypothetical protein